jgi:prolyl 4-hydroxylase
MSLDAEYTAHHDFGFSRIDDRKQGARYATLLLYLNEGMNGGETSFPRWQNAETFNELKVVPEVGKAVLFYSQLPDGNMDDFSHHSAMPVKVGGDSEEKW